MEQAQELVRNENILLQTLGFDVAIDHPHTHVVKCCQLVKASKELAQTSYFMATNRFVAVACWLPVLPAKTPNVGQGVGDYLCGGYGTRQVIFGTFAKGFLQTPFRDTCN